MVVVVVVVVVAVVPFCLQQLATTGLFILFSSSPGRRSTASLCTFSSSRSSLPARLSSTRQAKAGVARDPPHPLFNALLVSVACCGVACGPACGSRLLPAASILWVASSGSPLLLTTALSFNPTVTTPTARRSFRTRTRRWRSAPAWWWWRRCSAPTPATTASTGRRPPPLARRPSDSLAASAAVCSWFGLAPE